MKIFLKPAQDRLTSMANAASQAYDAAEDHNREQSSKIVVDADLYAFQVAMRKLKFDIRSVLPTAVHSH